MIASRSLPYCMNSADMIAHVLSVWYVNCFITLKFNRHVELTEAQEQLHAFAKQLQSKILSEHPTAHTEGIEFIAVPVSTQDGLVYYLYANCYNTEIAYQYANTLWRCIEPNGYATFCPEALRAFKTLEPGVERHYWTAEAKTYLIDTLRRIWLSSLPEGCLILGNHYVALVDAVIHEIGDERELYSYE